MFTEINRNSNNQTQDTSLAKMYLQEKGLEELKKFWYLTIGSHQLGKNETIRLTYAVEDPVKSTEQKLELQNTQHVSKIPINNVESLLGAMNYILKEKATGRTSAGFSISSAVFEHDEDKNLKPSGNNLKYKHSIVIDIDCYDVLGKDRINISDMSEITQYFAAYRAYSLLANSFIRAGLLGFKPHATYMTGGGFQFVIKWDHNLSKEVSQKVGATLNNILYLKRFELYQFGSSYNEDVTFFSAKVDTSFSDRTHTQRLAGTVNIKYGTDARVRELDKFSDPEHFNKIIKEVVDHYMVKCSDQGNIHVDSVASIFANRVQDIKEFMGNLFKSTIISPVEDLEIWNNLNDVIIHKQDNRSNAGKLTANDYEFLKQLDQDTIISALQTIVGADNIHIKGSEHMTMKCPFHPDNSASFAVYFNNGGVARLTDFHGITEEEEKEGLKSSYNFLEFWMVKNGLSKTDAMEELAERANISLNKSFYKSLHEAETEKTIEELIESVDVENKIYYRLANKSSSCIIRNKNTGETNKFDGPKMLTDHVLCNQLGRSTADEELKKLFYVKFTQYILIDSFEEFNPGKDPQYVRDDNRFVNMWIACDEYTKVKNISNEYDELSIDDALQLIKSELPWMYIYLHQITQRGHLPFFVNWLANLTHYEVMPIIPVITSVQGTGKNLFIDEVMNPFFNENYIKVVDGKKINNNFNSYMEDSSLIVIDEGDFSKTQEVDNIKYLSGNNKILIEKKGVDIVSKNRHFNFLMYTNGLVPIRHPINERRFSYYRLDVSLEKLCIELDTNIPEFIDNVRNEVLEFWAIIHKVKRVQNWNHTNMKDAQFFKQILLMHNFGILITQIINEEWDNITLQINEKVKDDAQMTANMGLIKNIRTQYEKFGFIQITLINRYIDSMEFKNTQSITEFIKLNLLEEYGITIGITENGTNIHIDKEKISSLINIDNNLKNIIPEYFSREEKRKQINEKSKDKQKMDLNDIKTIPGTEPKTIVDKQQPYIDTNVPASNLNHDIHPVPKLNSNIVISGASTEVEFNPALERLNQMVDPGGIPSSTQTIPTTYNVPSN